MPANYDKQPNQAAVMLQLHLHNKELPLKEQLTDLNKQADLLTASRECHQGIYCFYLISPVIFSISAKFVGVD